MKRKCEKCKILYPANLVDPIHTSNSQFDGLLVCGICYLEISNEVTYRRDKLDGPIAEGKRQAAIKYRRDTNQSPVVN